MSFADYQRKAYGYNQREMNEWRRTRALAYLNFLAHWQKKETPPRIEQYWPLNGDPKPVVKVVTADKFKEIFLANNPHLNNKTNG